MPTKKLPERLQYLQPAAERLAEHLKNHTNDEFPDDALSDELFDEGSWLEEIVKKHISEHPDEDTCVLLRDDLEAIQEYSQRRGVDSATWGSLHGWLMGYLTWGMQSEQIPFSPGGDGSVEMITDVSIEWEIPSGFQMTKCERERLTVLQGNATGEFEILSHSDAEEADWILDQAINLLRALPGTTRTQSLPVRFGEVHGKKWIEVSKSPTPSKGVTYLLSVPGGNVKASFTALANYDESIIESTLHTLRLARKANN